MLICFTNNNTTARKRAYDVNQNITILISTKCQSQKNAAKKKLWLLRSCLLPAFNLKKKQKQKNLNLHLLYYYSA